MDVQARDIAGPCAVGFNGRAPAGTVAGAVICRLEDIVIDLDIRGANCDAAGVRIARRPRVIRTLNGESMNRYPAGQNADSRRVVWPVEFLYALDRRRGLVRTRKLEPRL